MKGFKPCPVSGLRVAGDFQVSSAILLPAFQGLGSFPFKTRKELQSRQAKSETFTLADLRQLPELNPPVLMPNGNVGTPLRVFLELIRACRLPPRIITQLQLQFPKTGSSRRYGNVPFTYEDSETVEQEEFVYTAEGEEIPQGSCLADIPSNSREEPEEEEEEEEESHSDDVSMEHHLVLAGSLERQTHCCCHSSIVCSKSSKPGVLRRLLKTWNSLTLNIKLHLLVQVYVPMAKGTRAFFQRFSKASFHCFRRHVRRVSFIDEIY